MWLQLKSLDLLTSLLHEAPFQPMIWSLYATGNKEWFHIKQRENVTNHLFFLSQETGWEEMCKIQSLLDSVLHPCGRWGLIG